MKKTHWDFVKNSNISDYVDQLKGYIKGLSSKVPYEIGYRRIDHIQLDLEHLYPDHFTYKENRFISQLRSFLLYALFSGKIYRITDDFAKELAKVKVTVRSDCIPADGEIICIELPPFMPYKAVYIGTIEDPTKNENGQFYKRVEIQFIRDSVPNHDSFDKTLLLFGEKDQTIDDVLKEYSSNLRHIPEHVFRFVINAYLYIHSGKPDLRTFYPPVRPKNSKPKEIRKYEKLLETESGHPVIMVGFNFKKPIGVSGHFQGYWVGTGRTNLVIKWKDPYEKGVQNS